MSARAVRAPKFARGVLAAIVLFVAACGSTRSYRPAPGAYDRLPAAERIPLRGARQALAAGDLERASAYLEPVAARHGRNLGVLAFQQDLELARLRSGLGLAGVEPLADPNDAEIELREHYVALARRRQTAETWVLAARLEEDGGRALESLARAAELDPRCVWAHYARAWWAFRLRRFTEARQAIEAAFAIDPGHLPSMRLESQMLAGAGDVPAARRALELWLARTREDPLVTAAERAEALVDLATLHVMAGDPDKALAALKTLDDEAGATGLESVADLLADPARLELVQAAAHDARGDVDRALEACVRAEAYAPNQLLPLVQEALLVARRKGGADAERAAWQRVLERTTAGRDPNAGAAGEAPRAPVDLAALLYELMARARIERLERSEPTLKLGEGS